MVTYRTLLLFTCVETTYNYILAESDAQPTGIFRGIHIHPRYRSAAEFDILLSQPYTCTASLTLCQTIECHKNCTMTSAILMLRVALASSRLTVTDPGFFMWGPTGGRVTARGRATKAWEYRGTVLYRRRSRGLGLGSVVSSFNGVRSEAPTANDFLCILGLKNHAGGTWNIIFLQPDSSQFLFPLHKTTGWWTICHPRPILAFTSCFEYLSCLVYFTLIGAHIGEFQCISTYWKWRWVQCFVRGFWAGHADLSLKCGSDPRCADQLAAGLIEYICVRTSCVIIFSCLRMIHDPSEQQLNAVIKLNSSQSKKLQLTAFTANAAMPEIKMNIAKMKWKQRQDS
jgi:hypothetical protein